MGGAFGSFGQQQQQQTLGFGGVGGLGAQSQTAANPFGAGSPAPGGAFQFTGASQDGGNGGGMMFGVGNAGSVNQQNNRRKVRGKR
jgi:hypothetical protein